MIRDRIFKNRYGDVSGLHLRFFIIFTTPHKTLIFNALI